MESTRASHTARLIARSIILASLDPKLNVLVADGEAEALRNIISEGGLNDRLLPMLKFASVRWLFLRLDRILLPGIITHYLLRKRRIESSIEEAIAAGSRQVVILGAGYDTLAWRLHKKYPKVRFIELDHPATQKVKSKALNEGGNLYYRPIDLTKELPSEILQEFHADNKPTTFLLEGLTMYFQSERVAELLSDIANLFQHTKNIIFTFMAQRDDCSIGFKGENPLIKYWLKSRSEPFLWGIGKDDLPAFLSAINLQVDSLVNHEKLRSEYLMPHNLNYLPLAQGEIICNANPLTQ
jgi:methyltransferase (TIGR00027 family)